MSVSRIANPSVVTASPGESVVEVARRLDDEAVGSAVVVDGSSMPVGIVTDRDIAIRCVAGGHDPDGAISGIMTTGLRTVRETTSIEEALDTMEEAGVRRIVVVGRSGGVAGIVSLDDVMRFLAEQGATVGRLLRRRVPEVALY